MFNDYYFKREQDQDIIRESEKERIIRRIQRSSRDRDRKFPRERSLEGSSWSEKIGWASRNPGKFLPTENAHQENEPHTRVEALFTACSMDRSQPRCRAV